MMLRWYNVRPALSLFACVLPTLYLWTLPLLARAGFAVRGPDPTGVGKSVSHYISSAPATGLLAASFQWPIMQLWERHGIAYLERHCGSGGDATTEKLAVRSFASLVAMLVGFGGFVTFTVTWQERLHNFFVCLMCVGGLYHFRCLLRLGEDRGGFSGAVALPLFAGFFGFGAVLAMVAGKHVAGVNWGYAFWAAESLGLTGIIWCTACDDYGKPVMRRLSTKRTPTVVAVTPSGDAAPSDPRSPV